MTKLDVRQANIDVEKASEYISGLKAGGDAALAVMTQLGSVPGVVKKGEVKAKQNWEAVYKEAHEAGIKAGQEAVPTPMVVQQHSNPLDDNSPVKKSYFVGEGACGFAWITIFPGNCSFALWLKKNGYARSAYQGGMQVWVSFFNQSIARKEAYAEAFAEVLQKHDIKAYAGSRLD